MSKIVKELPAEKSVVMTKNGRPSAVLFPVTEETDLESMLLAQRKDFWRLLDRAHKEGEKKGFTRGENLPDRHALGTSSAQLLANFYPGFTKALLNTLGETGV